MITRNILLSTTAIACVRAFNTVGVMPVVPGAGNVDRNWIQMLVLAGQSAAGQQEIVDKDLMARDGASSWMLPYWDMTDDIVAGFDAIKAQAEKYLPKFYQEPQRNYDMRLGLAEFTNIFRDIVETLSAKPFEEEISLVAEKDDEGKELPIPDIIEEFTENVDGSGNNLTSYCSEVFFNGVASAIHWIYVDYPKVDPTAVRTQADEQALGIRPFWSHVLGRNVLEAKSQVINGAETLTYMRILEPDTPNRVRVFERSPNGAVNYALFEEVPQQSTQQKKVFKLIEAGPITIGVIPLVPFVTGRRNARSFKILPALRDAADVQIQLYKQESGLNYAKTMTAYPMLTANGVKPKLNLEGNPEPINTGPAVVLYAPVDGNGRPGSWAYVEPSAESLKFLKDDVKETMDQLRELGRQPLTAQSGNLTVITTAVAAGKSRSAVGAWTLKLKDAIENAMLITCKWLNMADTDYEPQVHVFDEFDDFSEDQASELTTLNSMRTSKDLSQRSYWKEMKRRAILSPDFDADDEEQALLNETPSNDDIHALAAGAGGLYTPPTPIVPPKPAPAKKPVKSGATK